MHDKNKTNVKSFEQGCRAMRVRFQCVASWEEHKLAKWKEAEDVEGFAETLVLVGLKRCRALADLQASLKAKGHASDAADLGKFFTQGNLRSMSSRVIGVMLRIWGRFAAAGTPCCEFGPKHTFSENSISDFLSANQLQKGSSTSLSWVLKCFCFDAKQGRVPANTSGSALKTLVHRYLLKRRIMSYVAKKFSFEDLKATDAPEEYWPNRVLHTVLGTVEGFRTSGLTSELPANLAWIGTLPEFLQRLLIFGSLVLRGAIELDQAGFQPLKLGTHDEPKGSNGMLLCLSRISRSIPPKYRI